MKKCVMFDLDGTLLPMDMEEFVKAYFGLLAKKAEPYGYEKKALYDAIWQGVGAVIKNDGTKKNEDVFWDRFVDIFGERVYDDKPLFDEFYRNEFNGAADACGKTPYAKEVIELCKELDKRIVLATNPIFPEIATRNRAGWVGVDVDDFEYVTTYENSCFCKPDVRYYEGILDQIGLEGSECVMVGNDVQEDLPAKETGMDVFLLTDCLINRDGTDYSDCPHGGFSELMEWLKDI